MAAICHIGPGTLSTPRADWLNFWSFVLNRPWPWPWPTPLAGFSNFCRSLC